MKAIDYRFSSEEIETIRDFQSKQKDGRLRNRFTSLLMLSHSIDIVLISNVLCVSIVTIERWFKIFHTKGPEYLNSFQYKPKKQLLNDDQVQCIIDWAKSSNPRSLKEIACYINENFCVKYSIDGVRKLLNRNGIRLVKPKTVPGGTPSVDVQQKHIDIYNQRRESSPPGTKFFY